MCTNQWQTIASERQLMIHDELKQQKLTLAKPAVKSA